MKPNHDRAFKEWAVACRALRDGRQTLLVRKGGIREEGGAFTVADSEFFLLPTYEHQNARLLKPEWRPELDASRADYDPRRFTVDAYAVVDTILTAKDEAQVNALAPEFVWNPAYVKERFDFNPYDPLYLLLLRAYRLPEPVTLDMRPEYEGCKSWVTLERPLSTAGAVPAIPDAEYAARRAVLLDALRPR